MRLFLLLLLICFTFSCSQQQSTNEKKTEPEAISYSYEKLKLYYPLDWNLTESKESKSNLITIKPQDDTRSGVITMAIFSAELPIPQTLLSMKGSVYVNLEAEAEDISEGVAQEVKFHGQVALQQDYEVNTAGKNVFGKFTVFNKSGYTYVIFWQTKRFDQAENIPIFETFEEKLELQ